MPRGYRLTRRGSVALRAVSLLDEDIDALEEAWEKAGLRGSERTVKVQAPGRSRWPRTWSCRTGTARSPTAGAVRDLTQVAAEGMAPPRASWRAGWTREVVAQLDEPSLPAALAGRLTG